VEQLAEVMASLGFSLAITQLAGGRLTGTVMPLSLGPLQLLRIRHNRAVHVDGAKPTGRQLFSLNLLDPRQAPPLRSHGNPMGAPTLFGLSPWGEIHVTVPEVCDLVLMSMDREAFHRWADELGCPHLDDRAFSTNWVDLDPQCFEGLRRYLLQLFSVAEAQPQLLREASWRRLALQDFGPLLITGLAAAVELTPSWSRQPARIELVKQVQGWMAENPNLPITLDDLCRQVYVSRRCLIQGFREHLGMGPMAYLKLQRLHGARRFLLDADPAQTTVTAAAATFGFLNSGHFARDYRQLFGELPSETLQACRR
jgi:AraC family ethanolamine operon transcriptional activator